MISIKVKSKLDPNDSFMMTQLDDVEQDEEIKWLSDSQYGICSYGHSSCYAIIISKGGELAIMHSSFMSEEFITEIMDNLSGLKEGTLKVTLARYFKAYTEDYEDEKKFCLQNNREFKRPNTEQYFAEVDAQYKEYFMKEFAVTPTFINMKHDFLVIQKNHKINLFDNFNEQDHLIEIIDNDNLNTDLILNNSSNLEGKPEYTNLKNQFTTDFKNPISQEALKEPPSSLNIKRKLDEESEQDSKKNKPANKNLHLAENSVFKSSGSHPAREEANKEESVINNKLL